MKINIASYCLSFLLAAAMCANADEPPIKAKKGSPEFEHMKTLVGTWKGKADIGHGPMDMTVQYRLLAGGSVLEERVFEGTPHEMITMYYDQSGKLALTHYCVFGNRPGMTLKSSDENTLSFDFDKTCGINTETESHMHSLSIHFDDGDTITTNCKAMVEGKEMADHPCTLKRVKSS